MWKITLTFLILTLASFTAISAQDRKCFRNESLQGKSVVEFGIVGQTLYGTYSVEISGDGEGAKSFEFEGYLKGKSLEVYFEENRLPDVAPSSIKSLVWRLETKGDEEVLHITFYGKNYETNKYADYIAEFEPCEPGYAKLKKRAKAVQFAKGKSSATASLSFRDLDERKAFSINIRQGQTLDIKATGCKISVRLPNGKLYNFVEWENEDGSEKTFTNSLIDRTTIKPVPQTGIYLVVLQKMAEEAQPDSVTFKISN